MIRIRRSNERGDANHGWLKSKHTFSFADYFDENQMGFGPLRVINEDRIEGGTGFGAHAHNDMEILSYVIEGALQHQDSMGNVAVIKPGEVQRMSAGTGIRHSEMNDLKDRMTHFLQIWIMPEKRNLEPGYAQKDFSLAFARGGLVLVASREGLEGSVSINRDANVYVAKSDGSGSAVLRTSEDRQVWIQVIRGEVEISGEKLSAGDGAAMTGLKTVALSWGPRAELMVFDMI